MSIIQARMAPAVDKEFVLFIIGMRVNKPLKLHKWLPVAAAMPRMLKELAANPDLGLMHVRSHASFPNFFNFQYWESIDKLMDYASNPDREHRPAWTEFMKNVGMDGTVGIWHETYRVPADHVEAIYGNMPRFGLGNAFELVPAEGSMKKAMDRLKSDGMAN